MISSEVYRDDVPFTDISKYTLDKYNDQYGNVYEKGTLIGMCLDIQLRKLSAGNYGLQNLIIDLSKKFGKDKPFKDEELFDEITKLTYPEIGDFLKRYVGGVEKLPLKELLNEVGVTYFPQLTVLEYSLGYDRDAITIKELDGIPKLAIANEWSLDEQGKALGLTTGDILIKINGEVIPDLGTELGPFLEKQQESLKDRNTLSYTIIRTNEAGKQSQVELKSPVIKLEQEKKYILLFDKNASQEKLALRQSWLFVK
jgi:predicted metalloprotease with PDZ domain